jgi:hypothetical protein
MRFWASNVLAAINDAIEVAEQREARMGFTMPSAYLGGLFELRNELLCERPIEIVFDTSTD